MYESHWGLRESPFHNLADPRYFYCSSTHEEALARLQFLVDHGRRLGLLAGNPGSGKTVLLDVFARQMQRLGHQVARLSLLSLDSREFLWELVNQLKLHPRIGDTPFELWRALVDRLAENRYQRIATVVLLDDADEASADALAYVTRMVRQDASAESRLTVVLAVDPRQLPRLGRRVVDLADLRIELEPWESADTSAYLQTILAQAGADPAVFEQSAAERLHELAGGIPRQITHLAELSLLAGAGRQQPHIDAETVESVYRELR
jgi:general secretion pathway protein A